jgi:sortase (surface protein transpeptidase)
MFRQHAFRYLGFTWLILALCWLSGCAPTNTAAAGVQHSDGLATSAQVVPTVKPTPIPPETPRRLLIPAINVNAPVEMVNITPAGDLGTPTLNPWVDTGWYASGPFPGQKGSAVIDGHLDRPGGYPAVFWYLRNLQPCDEVEVIDYNGKTLRFRVTDVEAYQPNDAPLQQIFGNAGGKYLNLITCAGDWIPSQHQTTLRLVVYTTLI